MAPRALSQLEQSLDSFPYYRLELASFFPEIPNCENRLTAADDPKNVALTALAYWNAYLSTGRDSHRERFLNVVSSLIKAERRSTDGLGLWPGSMRDGRPVSGGPQLSAGTQGAVASTLLRAHLLLRDEPLKQAARRALRALETEILDGGVQSIVGSDGVFFEDIALYPATHALAGFVVGLLGLHDYFKLFSEPDVGDLIKRSTSTLHLLIGLYDTGYWTRVDLVSRQLATGEQHSFHVSLLKALVSYSGCDHCARIASSWEAYQRQPTSRLHRAMAQLSTISARPLAWTLKHLLFSTHQLESSGVGRDLVCIALPVFPVPGGTRAIVSAIVNVMAQKWDVIYLTNRVGPDPGDLRIERFGSRISTPWQFPNVWFHIAAGLQTLVRLIRRGNRFQLLLPQDGAYTAFFSAIVGKALGARVVSVEHGTVMFPYSPVYREERIAAIRAQVGITRILSRIRLALYWPSLHVISTLAARLTDQFLVAGDEIEETYREHLGVHPSRIVRFNPSIDTELFKPMDRLDSERERARFGFSIEDLIIVMNGRLVPAKGLDIAISGLAHTLTALSDDIQSRTRLVIAGDGPMRSEVDSLISHYRLEPITQLWGEATPAKVATLLGMSDIFLYTSLRGTNTSLAVLEAMAAGCAVVASEQPRSHAKLLAEGRGISTPPGDTGAVASALSRVLNDPSLRVGMRLSARDFVVRHYGSLALKRALLRATHYSAMQALKLNS